MTEIVRKAGVMLAESERAANLRDRHRDYYVALAEQAELETRGPNQAAWWELLESEYDNIRLALEWSLSQGASEEALRLAIAVDGIWNMRGDFFPAREWLEKALAVDEFSATALRANALTRLAEVVWQNSQTEAFSLAQQALEVARKSGDQKAAHTALLYMGKQYFAKEVGGPDKRRALHDESLAIARELGDEHAIADSLQRLAGFVFNEQGGRDAGRKLWDESLRLYRKLGDQEFIAWNVYGLGWQDDPSVGASLAEEALAIARELKNDMLILCVIELIGWQLRYSGDYLGALRLFEEAADEYRRPGRRWPIPWGLSWMLTELANVELEMGEFESGRKHAEEASEINETLSYKGDRVWPLSLQGCFATAEGDYEKGKSQCEQAVAIAREVGRSQLIANSLDHLAAVARWKGDFPTAQAASEEHLTAAVNPGQVRGAWYQSGITSLAEGDLDQARSFLEESLESIHSRPWWPYEEPMTQLWLGRVALISGEHETASALYGAALTKLEEIGHKPFAAWALEEFGALAAERKEFDRGAKLFGAAEAIREEVHAKVPMDQRRTYEQGVAAIKRGLSDDAFKEAWAVGRAMSRDSAIQYALEASSH